MQHGRLHGASFGQTWIQVYILPTGVPWNYANYFPYTFCTTIATGWEKLEDIQCSQVELKGNLSSLSDKISESSTSHRILYFKSQSIFLDLLTLTLVVKLSSRTKPVTNSVNSGFPHFPGVIPKTTINCHSQKTLAPPTEYPPNLMWPHGGPTQPNLRHLPTLYNNTVD